MKVNGHDTEEAKEIAFHKYMEHLLGPGYALGGPSTQALVADARRHFDRGFDACVHLLRSVLAQEQADGGVGGSEVSVDRAKEHVMKGGGVE